MAVIDRLGMAIATRIARPFAVALTALAAASGGSAAWGQALTVLPVNITMGPGQFATALTVVNEGDTETSVQIRAYAWGQQADVDQLSASGAVLASPPLATIAPHAKQVVRLVLRQAPVEHEDTYRIILDQIPAPGAAGAVRLALRLSIPIFAQPRGVTAPHLTFTIANNGADRMLVASNTGTRHEALRHLTLTTASGEPVPLAAIGSPYVLAGGVRHLAIHRPLPDGTVLRLNAQSDGKPVDVSIQVGPIQVGAAP